MDMTLLVLQAMAKRKLWPDVTCACPTNGVQNNTPNENDFKKTDDFKGPPHDTICEWISRHFEDFSFTEKSAQNFENDLFLFLINISTAKL
jgi:hypothetical protein